MSSPDWDHHWQQTIFHLTPIAVVPADTLRVACTWDTTSVAETVTFGSHAEDETCLAAFYVTMP